MIQNDFAYLIPAEAFVYKVGGRWAFETPVGRSGILHWLLTRGIPAEEANMLLKGYMYHQVHGAEMFPGGPEIHTEPDGSKFINTWTAPTLVPEEGEYPSITRVLSWLTGNDDDALFWLVNWLALKVQNPAIVPKVACVFSTEPGAGKGTLFRIIEEMLGRENCANIDRGALENKFNARWARKLFVLADEVMSNENVADVSNRLKVLIDSTYIELEGKGKDQRSVKNRLAWVFASNDKISPVSVESGDRRYSVFSNQDTIPPDYKVFVNGLYAADRDGMTEEFQKEIQAFYYDLLHLEVDRKLAAKPYSNGARDMLIEAALPTHAMFCKEIDNRGVDRLIAEMVSQGEYQLTQTKKDWDRKEGISAQVLYQVYGHYCKKVGARNMRLNRFLVAIRNHRPLWPVTVLDNMEFFQVNRSGK